MKPWIVAIAMLWLVQKPSIAQDQPKFELIDGDRVVLIGGTMIERDQTYGYLETRLTRRYPDRNITFRNLGWSGDTVEGISRAGFGTPSDGFKQLVDHVLALKPTVIIVGYGANESFEGKAGLPKFQAGLEKLLNAVEPTKARLVFLSPTRQEHLDPPLPDPTAHNADLALYWNALKTEAEKRGAVFVDLFGVTSDRQPGEIPHVPTLTNNGIHLSEFGYWFLAESIERALSGARDVGGPISFGDPKKVTVQLEFAANLTNLETSASGVKFKLLAKSLPEPSIVPSKPREGSMRISGLAPGRYTLKIDGKAVSTASDETWKSGRHSIRGPQNDQIEALRYTINAKNELYFYRWRPQNETYLFGFRKHEQGQNAREIPLFDPLVEAKEAEIAKLRVPVPHVYELIREGEVGQ